MKININKATQLSIDFLIKLGLSDEESKLITQNLIEAELTGKKTHGFVKLLSFKKSFDCKKFNADLFKIDMIDESLVSIYLDGHNKLGYGYIYKSLERAFEKIKNSKLVVVGIKNLKTTGYIGDYARIAAENNLIFIGFNNSPSGLVPYGSRDALLGTNPITVGIPTSDIPVILDMASSQITWGDLLIAKNEQKSIKNNVAIDSDGHFTNDPIKVMDGGGLLPFFGHKGSGLAFIVALLAGVLTDSHIESNRMNNIGAGSFYILIDPTLFRPIIDFKNDIKIIINELKGSSKAKGFTEIYFAGERSGRLRQKQLLNGLVDISDISLKKIKNFLKK